MSYPQQPGYPGYPGQQPTYPPYPSGASSYPSSTGPVSYPYPGSNPYPQNTYPQAPPTQNPYYQQAPPTQNPYYQPPPPNPYSQQPPPAYSTPNQPTRMKYQGTVTEFEPFDANEDATVLRKAMKGLGTDEESIINVLARRTNAQRQQILISFKSQYGKDLIEDLKSELSGELEDVIMALMTPTSEYLAKQLHDAVSGIGTNEGILIEIMCTATNQQMSDINEAYSQLYGHPLEEDLKEDTSGNFKRLLVSLSVANRDESNSVDQEKVEAEAQELFDAGEGQWGTDESTFNCMLVSRSYAHLAAVFKHYEAASGLTMEEVISREFSGDIETGLLALARCVTDRPSFFAERLHDAMSGMGTDDSTLIRVVVSRAEIDMVQIKEAYQSMYEKALEDAIASETSGDYKKILVALVQ